MGRGTEVVTKESTVQRRGLTAQALLATCQHHSHHLLGVVMELGLERGGWGWVTKGVGVLKLS